MANLVAGAVATSYGDEFVRYLRRVPRFIGLDNMWRAYLICDDDYWCYRHN